VSQIGLGTLILTGANTHTGATIISAGTLQIGNASTTGSIAGDILDNKSLVFSRSDNLTYAGAISGTGNVTKLNAGILSLTGANTSTGVLTISAGTLQIGNGSSTGSIVGNVTDNSILAFNRSDSVTYAGIISGAGTVNQMGVGTLVLSGASIYPGQTTISSGTLQIGNGSATGSVVANITDNAALAFNRSDDLTYAGVISGIGTLTKLGAGTLTLTGANTYSGRTTITAGTLQVSSAFALQNSTLVYDYVSPNHAPMLTFGTPTTVTLGGLTGSFAGVSTAAQTIALINSSSQPIALLVGNNNESTTYGGNLSGSGSLTKTGSGTLTLMGSNTYTGGTTVSGGTINIANPNALPNGPLTVTGGTVSLSSVLTVNNLALTNGIVDIKDKGLIVNYSSTSPASAIRNYLITSYGPGNWSGTTGITSSAANADTSHHHTLAYADAAAMGITSLDGQTITGNAVLVKYTYPGDSNLDGIVDLDNDFSLFVDGYNKQISNPGALNAGNLWVNGDYNYDGTTNLDNDFSIFVDSYATYTQNPAQLAQLNAIINSMDLTTAQKNQLLSVVPEPGTWVLAAISIAGLSLGRKRRRD